MSAAKPHGSVIDRALVIAHGPSRGTLHTARSMKSHVAHVVVAAGTEPGVSGVRRVRDRGVDAIDGVGPSAIRQAIAGFDADDIVLVVHDDVELPGSAVQALALAHRESGEVCVPNTRGDDTVTRAMTGSTACLVGTARQIEALAAHGGFGPGINIPGPFRAVWCPDVHHRHDATRRLATTELDDGRPLLVASMIVKDESANLAACLESIAPFVDRIEIADTGSTDDTVDIALAAGANVDVIEWRDDFAWARNHVLDRCRDAHYVLWIDADERFAAPNPVRVRHALRTFVDHVSVFRTAVVDLDEAAAPVGEMLAPRVFRPDGVRFVGALHERIVHDDGDDLPEATTTEFRIDHLGYQREAVGTLDKFERNLRLARRAFEQEETPQTRAHLYRSLGRSGQSPRQGRQAIAEMDELISDFAAYDAPSAALMLTLRANLCLLVEDEVEAEQTARRALDLVAADVATRAVLVEALVRQGRMADAIAVGAAEPDPSPEPLIRLNAAADASMAWALLRAHAAEGNAAAALSLVEALPADRDPWPVLVADPGFDVDAGAALATSLDDRRLTEALSGIADADRLAAGIAAFERADATSALIGPLRRALSRVETFERSPELRAAFEATPTPAAAIAYAETLVSGEPDLAAELAGVPRDGADHGIAMALGIAAEAWIRRGDADAAVGDAVAALQHWPGVVRAGVIAASGAAGSGLADVALDIVEAVRQTADADDPHMHELTNVSVMAHLERADLDRALSEAAAIVNAGGELTTWPELIDATADDLERFAPVLGLALTSDGQAFIEATRHALPGDRAAITCLSYLAAGGTHPDAFSTGIVSAAVHGRPDVAELFIGHREVVDETELDGIASALRSGGHGEVADLLTTAGS